jgi:hypothetical protein
MKILLFILNKLSISRIMMKTIIKNVLTKTSFYESLAHLASNELSFFTLKDSLEA